MAIRFKNPLIRNRADPFIYRHTDGFYYFTATVPEYDRIELRRARTIEGLATAPAKVIWTKHQSGEMGSHIWAPEIHFIDGRWYIYFAAAPAEKIWDIRIHALSNDSGNPLDGSWKECGQIKTNWESFALDATTFEHRGRRYLVWAQHDPNFDRGTCLYIAAMSDPLHISGQQVCICRPQFDWERILHNVNEGPAVLIRNGRVFISYSASGTDFNYCMGLLTAKEDADLLNPASWTKAPVAVFKTCDESCQYGPGHNCFTIAEDGKTDVLIYHARDYKEIKGDPLDDPNRHTRAQVLKWKSDGTPEFGIPVADG
ncbi:MAG TPA: glycoside hydrolase family 43 protein [Tepidisphaeraceae bacterium]|jgi:GH43 family beta-xylosidase